MSNYQTYSNDDLLNMVEDLVISNMIKDKDVKKYIDAIFKRHHDKPFNDPELRRQAQQRNALQYYYKNKLIKMYEQLKITKTQK